MSVRIAGRSIVFIAALAVCICTIACATPTAQRVDATDDERDAFAYLTKFNQEFYSQKDSTAVIRYFAPDAKIFRRAGDNIKEYGPIGFEKVMVAQFSGIPKKGTFFTNISKLKSTDDRVEAVLEIHFTFWRNNHTQRFVSLKKIDQQWKIVRFSYDEYTSGKE